MYLGILRKELLEGESASLPDRKRRAQPGIKYFLVKYIHVYGDSLRGLKAHQIAKDLGVSDKVVTQSMSYLIANGYLAKGLVETSRGRQSGEYAWTDKLRNFMGESNASEVDTWCKGLIDDCLDGKATFHSFKIAPRLLLATLLAHADKCGVVRGLGIADIMRFTGMGRDRVEYQIDMLKDEGYIQFSVPGVTNVDLFGVSKGAYFLNLKHPDLRLRCRSSVIILGPGDSSDDLSRYGAANVIQVGACGAIRPKDSKKVWLDFEKDEKFSFDVNNDLKKIAKFFENPIILPYFQYKLNDYASYILSNYWDKLSDTDGIDLDFFNKSIESEFIPAQSKKTTNNYVVGKERELLIDFISQVSLALARGYKHVITALDLSTFNSADYVINAHRRYGDRKSIICFTIDCYGKNSTGEHEYVHLSPDKTIDGGYAIKAKGLEKDLGLEAKYEYGLLTRPKKHR